MIKKRFLTETDNGGGSVAWETNTDYTKGSKHPISIYRELSITDCSRKVSLEFWAGNYQQYVDKIDKINNLISALEEFRDHYKTAWHGPKRRYF